MKLTKADGIHFCYYISVMFVYTSYHFLGAPFSLSFVSPEFEGKNLRGKSRSRAIKKCDAWYYDLLFIEFNKPGTIRCYFYSQNRIQNKANNLTR